MALCLARSCNAARNKDSAQSDAAYQRRSTHALSHSWGDLGAQKSPKMFAPPPLQLSRVQIAQLKTEAEARQAEKDEKRKSTYSGSSGSLKKSDSPTSLQRSESFSPKHSRKLFSRSSKVKVSKPTPIVQPTSELPTSPEQRGHGPHDVKKKDADEKCFLPVPFGEQPRRAPVRPKRPARPASELFLPSPPGPPSVQPFTLPQVPAPNHSPPPVPEKSPRRRSSETRQAQAEKSERKRSYVSEVSLNDAFAKLDLAFIPGSETKPIHPPRASTVPVVPSRKDGMSSIEQPPNKTKRTTIDALPAVQGGKIGKAPGKRASAAASVRAALLDIDSLAPRQPRRATESRTAPARVSSPPNEVQLPWKRRRKGETISMLFDAGFFPLKELTVNTKDDPIRMVHVKVPPPLSLIDKELPDTPDSVLPTPTELYQARPKMPLPVTKRKVAVLKRSPLAQISITSAKANSGDRANDTARDRLSSIPELVSMTSTRENSPLSPGTTTPVATQMHLRNGSVLTVIPPECTAWQRHTYIQGPIELPKPAIMPRKNSVASLEAFQEVVDQVYQDALAIPRRRSDDAIVDDVCEWFDDFGFEDIGFGGDVLAVEDMVLDDIDEVQELDETDSQASGERFHTPPPEPVVSPIEKVVAKEVIKMTKPDLVQNPSLLLPVENEETLRARGIARLSQQTRKDSMTVSKPEAMLAITPIPEVSMLTAEAENEFPPNLVIDQGGMDWDDDDEELGEQPAWIAPALPHKQRALTKRDTRNPVRKMRRFMATASAIL